MKTPQIEFVIDISIEQNWLALCRQAILTTLQYSQFTHHLALTLLFSDDQTLQELNQTFLGENKATDVLSFPSGESLAQAETHLGEIAISVPRAHQQAAAAHHPVEAEIELLVVHGVLHLLGHDHAQPEEKAQMWQAQAAILNQLHAEQQWQVEEDQWLVRQS